MNARLQLFRGSFFCTLALLLGASFGFLNEVAGQISQVAGSPQAASTTTTTLTIPKPSGLAVGHVMIANILQSGVDNNSLSDATRSGWTEIAGSNLNDDDDRWRGTLLYRIADANDVLATSFAFSLDNDSDDGIGAIVAFAGVDVTGGVDEDGDPGGPFDVNPGNNFTNIDDDNTLTASAITTASANTAVLMFGVMTNNLSVSGWSTTNPGSLTELYDATLDAGLDMGIAAAWATKAAAGSTGSGTANISSDVDNGSILVALKSCSSTANAGANQEVCAGNSINLNGSIGGGANTATWSAPSGTFGDPNDLNTTYTPAISSGAVVLTLTASGGGCSTAQSTMTVTVNPSPTTTGVTICQGGSGSLLFTSACDVVNGTAGPNFAGSAATGGGSGNSWSNTNDIDADDGDAVTCDVNDGSPGNPGDSENLNISDFGFAIPAGATINGITVTINRWGSSVSSGGIQDLTVRLRKNGSPVGSNKAVTGTNWPTATNTVVNYGASNDTWGTTWTAADINDPDFGLTLDVINVNTSDERTASVDYVQITVAYTIDAEKRWYTAASGGTLIGTGSPFNPVGVPNSGLPNTNTPGTYTFWAECSLEPGCRTATDFVIDNGLTATISGTPSFCPGGSTTLTAGGGVSYLWDDNSTDAARIITTPGMYSVTVTDGNNCTDTESVTVTQLPSPTATIGGTPSFCAGGSTTLVAGGGVSYIWDNGSMNAARMFSMAGSYSVTVTAANGCTDTESGMVTQLPNPTATISGTPGFCAGGSTTLTAGGGGTYLWDNGSMNAVRTINAAGLYWLTVTAANGCTDTESVMVAQLPNPTATISGTPDFCAGGSTTLTAGGGGTYLWDDNSTDAARTVSAAGTYSVTVTAANGCTDTESVLVTEKANPTATISGTPSFCAGGSTTLTAGGAGMYLWDDNSTNGTRIVSAAGTYSVTVTAANGCTDTESVLVTQKANPVATISGTLSFCAGDSTTLTAGGGGTYLWDNNSANAARNISASGTYWVTVTAANGCTDAESAVVTQKANPVATISGALSFCAGDSTKLTAGGGGTYLWNNGSPSAMRTITASGTYSVTVTAANGCTDVESVMVTMNSGPNIDITFSASYCPGDPGPVIGVASSLIGYNYQLKNNMGNNLGSPVAGTGHPIYFGSYPNGTYSVVASGGLCGGSATKAVNAAPGNCEIAVPGFCTCSSPGGYTEISVELNAPNGQNWTVKNVIGLYYDAGGSNFQPLAVGTPLTPVGGNQYKLIAFRSDSKGYWVQVTNGNNDYDIMVGNPGW